MGKKHIKRCSMSLVMREIQNKTAVRYHFTSTEEARLNFFLWLCSMPCGILVPQPRIEPMSPAVETQNTNHRTAREVLRIKKKNKNKLNTIMCC